VPAGDLPTGREGPHVFVEDLEAPAIDGADRHHLERVLRLRPGDPLTVSDGAGRWRACRYGTRLEIIGDVIAVAAAKPPITIAFAVTKGERPELVVQKMTELGVDRIVPFTAARSVARWSGGRADRHGERLRRVAREAAMQSRRVRLPEVSDVATFDEVAALPRAALAERHGSPPTLTRPVLIIGPEGGWTDTERGAGLPEVGLGPGVLRSETAAITAAAVLTALRARIVTASDTKRSE